MTALDAHREARQERARLMGRMVRRALKAVRRWTRSLGRKPWLRPLSYG
jgi:hypothetical protein